MTSPVFHLFEKLPQELQMQVWRYAASPEGTLNLDESFLRLIWQNSTARTVEASSCHARFLKHASTSRLEHGIARNPPMHRSEAGITAAARTSLLGTCRLARQIVLETWKADIQKISIGDWSHFPRPHYLQRQQAAKNVPKVEILAALDGLVALVQNGQASCIPRRFGASRRTITARPGMYTEQEEADEEELNGDEEDGKDI